MTISALEQERLLDAGFEIAKLVGMSDLGPSPHFGRFVYDDHQGNIAIRLPGTVVFRSTVWCDLNSLDEMFDGAPTIVGPAFRQWIVALPSLTLGRVGGIGKTADLVVTSGALLGRIWPDGAGLQSLAWRDPENIVPTMPVSSEVVAELKAAFRLPQGFKA